MKVAICYLTNTKKDQTISKEIYKNLSKAIKDNPNNENEYDIYVLSNVDKLPKNRDSKTYPFTWDQLREKYNYIHKVFYKDYMGVCHLPLFYLQDNQPDYDYYIFYEDDLYFTGFKDGLNPFDKYVSGGFDMVFAYGRIYNPAWYWVSQFAYRLPEGWYGFEGLLNCYIISNKALKDLKEFCCDGKWFGHHELLVNSFFKNQPDKYKVTSLNHDFDSRIFLDKDDLLIYLKRNEKDENTFLHPIKTVDLLKMVKK